MDLFPNNQKKWMSKEKIRKKDAKHPSLSHQNQCAKHPHQPPPTYPHLTYGKGVIIGYFTATKKELR
jgi:hypothetical protein